jgi:hypothetical protein
MKRAWSKKPSRCRQTRWRQTTCSCSSSTLCLTSSSCPLLTFSAILASPYLVASRRAIQKTELSSVAPLLFVRWLLTAPPRPSPPIMFVRRPWGKLRATMALLPYACRRHRKRRRQGRCRQPRIRCSAPRSITHSCGIGGSCKNPRPRPRNLPRWGTQTRTRTTWAWFCSGWDTVPRETSALRRVSSMPTVRSRDTSVCALVLPF